MILTKHTLRRHTWGEALCSNRPSRTSKPYKRWKRHSERYAREEGRAPFELKTQPAPDCDEAATLDLVQKTAEALKSAERRIEELETLREELVRMTRARMERAQAALDAAERRAREAERLANDAEEKAKKSRECLTWVREAGRRALSQGGGTCQTARGDAPPG